MAKVTLCTIAEIREALIKVTSSIRGDSIITNKIDKAEGDVLSKLPTRYYDLYQGKVYGEIVVWDATLGQTTGQLGLYPASDVVLFKNASESFDYKHYHTDDGYIMELTTDYTIDLATGAITFVAGELLESYRITANYTHASAVPEILNSIGIDLAGYYVLREIYTERDPSQSSWVDDWFDRAMKKLDEIASQVAGIREWDELEFVKDWKPPEGSPNIDIGNLDRI